MALCVGLGCAVSQTYMNLYQVYYINPIGLIYLFIF